MKTIFKSLSIFLLLFSALLTAATISNFVDDEPVKNPIATLMAALVMIGIPAALGFILWKKATRIKTKTLAERHENTILEEVRRNGGHITPAELAMRTNLSISEAKQALEELQLAGHTEVDVTEEGALEYHFRGLKNRAK